MDDVERASVSRSLIAVAMLLFGSLIFFYVWQSSDDVLPHSVLIVVGVAIIAWAFWRYRGSRTRQAAPTSTIPPANNFDSLAPTSTIPPANSFDSLVERHRETIATYKDRIGLRASYDDNVTDVVRDCIRNIAEE